MITDHPARHLALAIADRLAHPELLPQAESQSAYWHPQSLAYGIPGIALLHIELAAVDARPWQRVYDWLAALARQPVLTGPGTSLFHGAPAVAHALRCAATVREGTYRRALSTLDGAIAAEAQRCASVAHKRMDHQSPVALAEYDLIRGLTGFGRYLLRSDPNGTALRDVLAYLVRLTEPIAADPCAPGWYTAVGPSGRVDDRIPGGHANNGVAHGIAGPLSLLALAALEGITVAGQHQAIKHICDWFDHWKVDTATGPVWPYWISRGELDRTCPEVVLPQRPSWCYGAAGHTRTLQLAALARGDTDLRATAQAALPKVLSDPARIAATTDVSLCHGFAGLAQTVARGAAETPTHVADQLRALLPGLLDTIYSGDGDPAIIADGLASSPKVGSGLLDGAAGTALALAACTISPPRSGWQTCLLTV